MEITLMLTKVGAEVSVNNYIRLILYVTDSVKPLLTLMVNARVNRSIAAIQHHIKAI